MKRRYSNILTLIIGIFFGVLIGMLFSPSKGTTIRSLFFYQIKQLLQTIKNLVVSIINFRIKSIPNNTAKAAGQEVIDKTIEKARKILEEAKALSKDLDDNNIKS